MPNTYLPGSKVIIGGETIIDLTQDDVTAADVASGKKFHLADGSQGTGSSTKDADTSDGTVTAPEILTGKKAYVQGAAVNGSMPNRGAQTGGITDKDTPITIKQGYHDGSGAIGIDATEKAKIVVNNIRQGVTLLGVQGSMTGTEDMNAENVSVTPSLSAQTILPDSGYNCIAQVAVAAIPVVVTDNAAGGKTYTIG